MSNRAWWIAAFVAFWVAGAAAPAGAQQTRALVIEGQADPDQLEQVQREFGAVELEGEPEILLVTPEQAAQVRTRLESLGLDVESADQHFFSVLAPAGASLTDAQRTQLEELASTAETRVTVLRSQPAQVAALAFSGRLAAPPGAVVSDTDVQTRRGAFTIELDGGRSFVLSSDAIAGALWSGASGDTVADLVYADGLIGGSIQTPTSTIQILPLGNDLYAAVEAPKSAMGDDNDDLPMSTGPTGPPNTAACPTSAPCTIRVGVVYSREAAAAAGPNASYVLATTPIEYLRGALAHADLAQRIQINLFGALVLDGPQASPPEPQRASVRAQRMALLEPEEDSWEARVRDWRRENRIDVVMMVGRWTSAAEDLCGKAGEVGYQNASRAYAVVNFISSCNYGFTFGHEFGHLLGMAHDRRTLAIQSCAQDCAGFPVAPPKGADRTSYLQQVDEYCASHSNTCPTPTAILGYCAAAGGVMYGTLTSYPFNCANSNYVSRPWWSNRSKQVPGTTVNIGDTYANQIARLPEAARRVAAHSEQLN